MPISHQHNISSSDAINLRETKDMDEGRIRFCNGTIIRLQMLLLCCEAKLQVSDGLLVLLTLQADLSKLQARLGCFHLGLLSGVSDHTHSSVNSKI